MILDGGVSVIAALPGNPRIDLIKPIGELRFTNVSVSPTGLVLHAQLNVEKLLR